MHIICIESALFEISNIEVSGGGSVGEVNGMITKKIPTPSTINSKLINNNWVLNSFKYATHTLSLSGRRTV